MGISVGPRIHWGLRHAPNGALQARRTGRNRRSIMSTCSRPRPEHLLTSRASIQISILPCLPFSTQGSGGLWLSPLRGVLFYNISRLNAPAFWVFSCKVRRCADPFPSLMMQCSMSPSRAGFVSKGAHRGLHERRRSRRLTRRRNTLRITAFTVNPARVRATNH